MMKIVGVVLAMAGTNGVFNGHPLSEQGGVADMVTGGLIFVAGVAIFSVGVSPLKHRVGWSAVTQKRPPRASEPPPRWLSSSAPSWRLLAERCVGGRVRARPCSRISRNRTSAPALHVRALADQDARRTEACAI